MFYERREDILAKFDPHPTIINLDYWLNTAKEAILCSLNNNVSPSRSTTSWM